MARLSEICQQFSDLWWIEKQKKDVTNRPFQYYLHNVGKGWKKATKSPVQWLTCMQSSPVQLILSCDQHKFCPNNNHVLPKEMVTRVNKMITKMLWSLIKFSQLIL